MTTKPAARPIVATLRTARGDAVDIRGGPKFDKAALAWSYIARHRIRWQRNESARAELAGRCVKQLGRLGVRREMIDQFAANGLVEVTIPYARDGDNRTARLMPWEYLISAATGADSDVTTLIVRHLKRARASARPRPARRAAVVIGATEAIRHLYTFETERDLPARALGIETVHLDDTTASELEHGIAMLSPGVIHVGGMDPHQAADTGVLQPTDQPLPDGMVLVGDKRVPVPVPAKDLARILTAGRARKPALVALNLYRSSAETAALTVAAGADVALGFQDTFEDLAAELFFGEYYRAWQASRGDPLVSFCVAWRALERFRGRISGSGLVIWTARSLVKMDVKKLGQKADIVAARIASTRGVSVTFPTAARARKALRVSVEPMERLNYALLHNRQPMFKVFELRNVDEKGRVGEVRVEAELFAGMERLPYATTLSVGRAPVSVGDKIFIPLTSSLVRSLREPVRASLRVSVSVGLDQVVHDDTYRVTLLPTDEWVDDDENRQWLPSFVFPQDPAIEQVVNAARPYLMFLADSASAGFDGYQSVDPGPTAENRAAGVDWQVEALWSALVHALPLGYINPPPTYTERSQRLRAPSRVLTGRQGTCIDLALLMASCLEYVNIYPVVFLLEGHAFPGYWRTEDSWDRFINMRHVEGLRVPDLERLTLESGSVHQAYPWVFPNAFHAEILEQIELGNLVPLETVWITTHATFKDAQDTGWENLLNAAEFHSLVDVTTARQCDVTPLPPGEEG